MSFRALFWWFFAVVLIAVNGLYAADAFGATSRNLVLNASFEGDVGWDYRYGRTGSSHRTTDRSLDGRYSLKLSSEYTYQSEGYISSPIPVTGGTRYEARAMVYRESGHGAHLYVKYFDSNGQEVASFSNASEGARNEWAEVSLVTQAPADANNARLIAYYLSNRTGISYFDKFSFSRAPSQSLVPNEDFSVDGISKGYPVSWKRWASSSEPVSVTRDPLDNGNKVLGIFDSSESKSGNAMSVFDIEGGLNYRVSAEVLALQGSSPGRVYIKFYDSDGNQLRSRSKGPEGMSSRWETVSFSIRAPINAESAAVVLYCSISDTCTSYFDDISVREYWVDVNSRYVSAEGSGQRTGLTRQDAAVYNDAEFWSEVDDAVDSFPVRVVFLEGDYILSSIHDRLMLYNCGSLQNRLVLSAESIYGSEFILADNDSGSPMIRLDGCNNVSLRNMRFSGNSGSISTNASDALQIKHGAAGGDRLIIEGMTARDLPNLKYGGLKLYGDLNRPKVIGCEFIRSGSGAGYHHIYAAGNSDGLLIDRSYFQDSSGPYVDLRKRHDDVLLSNSVFFSSGNYINEHVVFVGLYAINNVDPGDEWFGSGYRFIGNQFEYSYRGSYPIRIAHKGFNPVDDQGEVRRHLLSPYEKSIMLDHSGQSDNFRSAILSNNFRLPPNDSQDGMCLERNVVRNAKWDVALWTKEMFGSESESTTSGLYNIDSLFWQNHCSL